MMEDIITYKVEKDAIVLKYKNNKVKLKRAGFLESIGYTTFMEVYWSLQYILIDSEKLRVQTIIAKSNVMEIMPVVDKILIKDALYVKKSELQKICDFLERCGIEYRCLHHRMYHTVDPREVILKLYRIVDEAREGGKNGI